MYEKPEEPEDYEERSAYDVSMGLARVLGELVQTLGARDPAFCEDLRERLEKVQANLPPETRNSSTGRFINAFIALVAPAWVHPPANAKDFLRVIEGGRPEADA